MVQAQRQQIARSGVWCVCQSDVVDDDSAGSELSVLPLVLDDVQTPLDDVDAQSVRVPPQSVSRHHRPDVLEPRRQQHHATVVVIRHEDELLVVDGHVPRHVELERVRGAGGTAKRLDYVTVDVQSTDPVHRVLQTAVTDDKLSTGELDRVPRVGEVVAERERADRVAAWCELFDGADVVAGDEDVVRGGGHRHPARSVGDRPLRHRPVNLHAVYTVVDVVRHEQTSAVTARRHVRETLQVWNGQTPEKSVVIGVEDFDLFAVLPAQHIDVVVQ